MCKVSIIMTSYNKPKYVGKTIEAILNQTFKDFELILMDDNSNEATQNIIRRYLKDDRIKFFRSDIENLEQRVERNRYAAQINKALKIAKGEYISYATDDNVYHPLRLEKMVAYLDKRPKAKICYSGSKVLHYNIMGDHIKTEIRRAKSLTWLAPCAVDHCSIMHRAEILPTIYKRWGSHWDEDPHFYLIGDARFFWRVNHYWPFLPINEVLDTNYITETSLHTQMQWKDRSEFIKLLPTQRTCKEIRDELKKLGRCN